MKGIIAILFLLINFSFIAGQSAMYAQQWEIAMEQNSPVNAGEEQQNSNIIEEELKEKYCSSFSTALAVPPSTSAKGNTNHLQHYPSGFSSKPYMPPEVI